MARRGRRGSKARRMKGAEFSLGFSGEFQWLEFCEGKVPMIGSFWGGFSNDWKRLDRSPSCSGWRAAVAPALCRWRDAFPEFTTQGSRGCHLLIYRRFPSSSSFAVTSRACAPGSRHLGGPRFIVAGTQTAMTEHGPPEEEDEEDEPDEGVGGRVPGMGVNELTERRRPGNAIVSRSERQGRHREGMS